MDAVDNFDSYIDDITPSQICEQIENEHEVFDGIPDGCYLPGKRKRTLPSNPNEHVFDAVFDWKCDIIEPCSEVESNSTV